jgi:hypothetical protein
MYTVLWYITFITNRCAEAAAKHAYIDILQYLREQRCKRTPTALCAAAEHCTALQLKDVMHAGIKGNSSAIAYAAKR